MKQDSEEPLAKVAVASSFYELIQTAYIAFRYPKPTSTEVCNCCTDPEIMSNFFCPAIEELPLRYVRDWFEGACDPHSIAKETWAYLIPRILEILACGEEVTHSLEISLNRFGTGNPANWSAEEWAILDEFQRLYLKAKMEPVGDALDDVLCMFSLAGWRLDDLLLQVSAFDDGTLTRRLWRDWCYAHVPGREGIWITAFWENPNNSETYGFYTSDLLYDRMANLALSYDSDPELATTAAAVASVIETSRV